MFQLQVTTIRQTFQYMDMYLSPKHVANFIYIIENIVFLTEWCFSYPALTYCQNYIPFLFHHTS